MKKYILAIDQGTTGSRALIYDRSGRTVAGAYQEFPQYFPRPGWVEHDPEEIWMSVNASIQKALSAIDPGLIAAIGITNQRETSIVWNRATGKPVYNAIVWQCRRSAARCEELRRKKSESVCIRERTGLVIDAYFSATKIEWILEHVPGALEKARQGALAFGTSDTWILSKLTGGRVHATDPTNASRTMLFNIDTKVWDPALLKMFSIPGEMMPSVKLSSGAFGETDRIGRLPAGIPITGIAGDQQAALFGQACFEPGSVKNTYGTGSFILMNAGSRRPRSDHGLIVTLGCGRAGESVYCLEGAVFIAGAAIQWLRDGLQIIDGARDSERMARSVADTAGVYFVPAFVGLGAPYWDPQARGAIIGLTRGVRREHLVRAALEAIGYQTRDVLEAMQKDAKLSFKEIRVDGGAAANNFLCQFQADIVRKKIVRPRVVETTSLGAAFLAGLAVGFWKNAGALEKCRRVQTVFKPRMSAPEADELCRGWKNAVSRTLSRA